MNETEFLALSAGAALNALSDDDRRAFESALVQHPEWAQHVKADADTVALLGGLAAPVLPPAPLRADLLARVAATPQDRAEQPDAALLQPSDDEDYAAAGPAPVVSVDDPGPVATPRVRTRARGRMGQRWFALAASVVLIAGIGFGAVIVTQQMNRPAAVVALEQVQNAADAQSASVELTDGGEATAYWSGDLGQAVLVSDGLPTLASDQTFEMWFVRDAGAISAGTFDATGGDATSVLAGSYQPGDVIAVTVEPAGGAPDGAPTSEPIVAIATA